MKEKLTLVINSLSTYFLVGAIWTLQLLHFPFYDYIDKLKFRHYIDLQFQQALLLFFIPLLLELLSTVIMFKRPYPNTYKSLNKALLLFLAIVWGTSIITQLLIQGILSQGFHVVAHKSVVILNWLRTVSWTAKGFCLSIILYQALRGITPTKDPNPQDSSKSENI